MSKRSFIYAGSYLQAQAAYPPATDGPSLTAGVFGLATHEKCGLRCHHRSRWALNPPFHPYPLRGGYFMSPCMQRRRRLSVRKHDALYCPDFPPGHFDRATDRLSGYFLNFNFAISIIRLASFSSSSPEVSIAR